jgi:hypothetical protein
VSSTDRAGGFPRTHEVKDTSRRVENDLRWTPFAWHSISITNRRYLSPVGANFLILDLEDAAAPEANYNTLMVS